MRIAVCFLAIIVAGCGTRLPRPVSPEPKPSGQAGLRAGFGRADITPPPGGGLFGYGPEGKNAAGYRTRLNARALVLEDASGERIAFVITDLGANSVLVHRMVARATRDAGIGADRLILAATHTHAGPTHHFGLIHDLVAAGDNMGFDTPWTLELSRRIASAIDDAVSRLEPARAGWQTFPVWGVTHNRNLVPYANNRQPWQSPFATPAGLADGQKAIDPAWTMLRVDTRGADGAYHPAGGLSIFAMHGTGAPNANDLYDADLHGMISNAIERGIDRMNGRPSAAMPAAFHLFAQGSEGDASAMPPETRCALPKLKNPGEFGPRPELTAKLLLDRKLWEKPSEQDVAHCISSSRARMQWVADTLSSLALDAFARIPTTDDLRIRRAFTTVYPKELSGGICEQPRLGTASLAGPIDGQTRLVPAAVQYIEEGGSAIDTTSHSDALSKCQSPKRVLFVKAPIIKKLTQSLLYQFKLTPREAQLAVVRVGPQVIATAPAELTTTAGGRIKDAIADALQLDRKRVATMGVTNGYLNYVASADEYALQHYEGSSTLYGPHTAQALTNAFVALAKQLPDGDLASPKPVVGSAYAWTDDVARHRFASRKEGPEKVTRCIGPISVSRDTVTFTFRDLYPGRFMRAAYPLLQIEQRAGAEWQPLTWDNDPQIEIRALRPDGRRGYWWSVRWTPRTVPATWRVALTPRGANPELRSDQPGASCDVNLQ